jgi:hypothetical protein
MQIRMLALAAGPMGVLRPGEVVEVTDALGEGLIAVGAAQATTVPVSETATVGAPEAATAPAPKRKAK